MSDAEREALSSMLVRLCCDMTDEERRLLLKVCTTPHSDPGGQAAVR